MHAAAGGKQAVAGGMHAVAGGMHPVAGGMHAATCVTQVWCGCSAEAYAPPMHVPSGADESAPAR